MRISVPGLPHAILSAKSTIPPVSPQEAIYHLSEFIKRGNVLLITGAGVSVDSGIRAYRGQDGRYMNPNYKPILYHEFVDEGEKGRMFRQRYWLRSYLGYPPVRDSQPNTTHYALAALQHTAHIPRLVTQNVDGLHHKALTSKAGDIWTTDRLGNSILELHGSIHRVVCRLGHIIDRETFQDWLSLANPKWKAFADEMERTGAKLRTNPDGDVAIDHLGISYDSFVVPDCPRCSSEKNMSVFLKPEFVFFGESIPESTKSRSFKHIEDSDRVLLMGTTLATHSSFRLAKYALELKKPVAMLNVGPTRADDLPGVTKIEHPTGLVMRDVAKAVIGNDLTEDPLIHDMLHSGIVKPPSESNTLTNNCRTLNGT
ncbi:DHS-like NAD/FAD-binding domain-containing protein [Amanita rubescens]|nr:DHS-like NAD/FAD-binding domain-containing protein [Amanita rubescens]